MYHEQTYEQIKKRRRLIVLNFVIALALCISVALVYRIYARQAREQGAESIRAAIVEAANQCAAIEGSYPLTLAYLENSYGLAINHDDYVVIYEAFAGNVAPSVVVMAR